MIHEQIELQYAKDMLQRPTKSGHEPESRQKQIITKRDPDLREYRVAAGAQKRTDPQVLLNPF